MNIIAVIPRFVTGTSKGQQSGLWVAESNYRFFLHPDSPDAKKCVFQVWAKLNLEFEAGGSIEYICEVFYELADFGKRPMLMNLIILGEKVAKDLDEFFER